MWTRIARWFREAAEHTTVKYLEEPGAGPLRADQGYVRLWLEEGFLAHRRSWGAEHFPVLHGGLALRLLGRTSAPFTSFSQLPESVAASGAYLKYEVTPLLPFTGGVVEIEGALYKTSTKSLLAGAAMLAGGLKPLLVPPLSAALDVVEKVSESLDRVLADADHAPVLGVHWAAQATGYSGNLLVPGHLVVVDAKPGELPGTLAIHEGRLVLDGPGGHAPITGRDYLVLRLECTTERDDWHQPELDQLIRQARAAFLRGEQDAYDRYSKEAVIRAINCPDFVPSDQKRVALLVRELIEDVAVLGAASDPELSLDAAARDRLPSADDPRVLNLQLEDLLDFR
jgi:hypothetical protein